MGAACSTETKIVCGAGKHQSGGVCVCSGGLVAGEKGCVHDAGMLPPLMGNVVDNGGDTGNGIGMALDGADYPHLAYFEANNLDLRYATPSRATGKWATENIDIEGDVGEFPALAISDPQGAAHPVITYYDIGNQSLKGAVHTDAGWVKKFLDPVHHDPMLDRGRYSSVAVENGAMAHVAHVSYLDSVNQDLYYLTWNLDQPGEVGTPVLVDNGISNVGGDTYGSGVIDGQTSIALDPVRNAPVIAYRDAKTADLKLAVYNPVSHAWDISFVDNDPVTQSNYEDLGEYASLAVDAVGNYHVAYYDRTNLAVRYAHFDGSAWAIETIDRGNVGTFSGVAIRASDRSPFVAYFDASNGVAKVAHKRRDGTWQVEVAATQGISGLYLKVAVTSNGWPAIAYRELFSQATFFDYVLSVFP